MTAAKSKFGDNPPIKDKSVFGEESLTHKALNRAVAKGIRHASIKAMKIAGSVVTVNEGWVVRKYVDGRVERLEKLDKVPSRVIERKVSKLASN